jgi:hypothetical protein
MKRIRGFGVAAATALIATTFLPAPASATFHEMSIREIYAGSASFPNAEYIELQMWRSGQNFVGGHALLTYNAGGGLVKENFLATDVSGDANQSTILIATAEVATQFPTAVDEPLSPGQIDPAGGAVCWEEIDCVSWGSFSGSLPGTGAPATAIPDGMALRRTIAPGCATLLEPTDDRDNSATDFAAVLPAPRPNSAAPGERACAPAGGQQGGAGVPSGNQSGHGAPQTRLKRKPRHNTHDRSPAFAFTSDEAGSSFQCKLDSRPFRSCRSPFTAAELSPGPHRFAVRARDKSGRLDPSPATYAFRVTPKRR